jgi:carotenoid cleavage dioxygenase-like enzyme
LALSFFPPAPEVPGDSSRRPAIPGRKTFDEFVHAFWAHPDRVEIWTAPPGHYLGGEPAFAPDPEGGGAVICQRFDAEKNESAFLVFNAFNVRAGPVAVLPLDAPLHLGFHAVFHPEPLGERRRPFRLTPWA